MRETKKENQKMKIENAIKKLNKTGFVVTQKENLFSAKKEGCRYLVEFWRNGNSDEATCIGYRHEGDESDSMIDYCATFFCDNITQAIRRAQS